MFVGFSRRWGDCKLCQIISNPYYAPASYLAKLCVNLGTFIWAIVVLLRENALDGRRWYIYEKMTAVMPEDFWAWGAIIFVVIGIYRLFIKAVPHWYGSIGYICMMLFWVYLAASLYTPAAQINPASPAGTASVTVMAFLSIYAAATSARRGNAT